MMNEYSHLQYLGVVRRKFEPKSYGRTNELFKDALIANYNKIPEWAHDYQPAQKTLQGAINSFRRFDNANVEMPEPYLSKSYDWMVRMFTPHLSGSVVTPFSNTISFMDGTKSPGYPWSIDIPTKADYWEEPIGAFYSEYWDALATENPIWSLSALNHKVGELIPIQKILDDKPRTVIAMDVNHTTAILQMFGDQADRLVASPLAAGSCVGISIFNNGWHSLAAHVTMRGRAMSIDGRTFDAKFWFVYFMLIAQFRYNMLHPKYRTPANWLRSRNLYLMLALCYVVFVTGSVHLMDVGHPSGQGLTTHDNGFKAVLDFGMIWQICTPPEFHTFEMYTKHCSFFFYSDDNLPVFSDTVYPYFTADSIGRAGKQIGMDYTFVTQLPVAITELTFLSMGWTLHHWHGRRALMPLHNCHKAMSSLLYGGKNLEPAHLINRFGGLSIMAWPCKECKPVYQLYEAALRKHFHPLSTPAVKEAWKCVLSDYALGCLFYGVEPAHRQGINHFEVNNESAYEPVLTAGLEILFLMPPKQTKRSTAHKAAKAAAKAEVKKAVEQVVVHRGPTTKVLAVKGPHPHAVVVKGRGDYVPTRFNRVGGRGGYFSDLGSSLGRGVGSVVDVGKGLFDIITGRGDYQHRSAAVDEEIKTQGGLDAKCFNMGAMNVQFGGINEPRVKHREMIGVVLGSTGFKTTAYRIQPGLRGANVLFPWGSNVANCFTQYNLNGLILEYKTRSTNYSSSVQLGAVMMSTVYDAEAVPLASQLAIDNHEFTTSDTPDKSFYHPVELGTKESPIVLRYVNSSNAVNLNDDARFQDVGIFQISTIGMPNEADGAIIGELWATYDITFQKPVLPDIHAGTSALFTATNLANGELFASALGSLNWDQGNSYPVTVFQGSNNTIQLPVSYAGSYIAVMTYDSISASTPGGSYPYVSFAGSDITPLAMFAAPNPLGVAQITDSAQLMGYGNVSDYTNANSDKGAVIVYMFSTIAESLTNNVITFNVPSMSVGTANFTLLITAVDSDLPTGSYAKTAATPGPQYTSRAHMRREVLDGARSISQFQGELEEERKLRAALLARITALEQCETKRMTPMTPFDIEPEEEKGTEEVPRGLSNSIVMTALRQALDNTARK
jgi:hypothetical protein